MLHARASELISALALEPHPEGGYFREIHRSAHAVAPRDGRPERSALTVIHFLLPAGEVSRWHRVASDEAWHFLEGASLELHEADRDFDTVRTIRLGPFDGTSTPAHIVTAEKWQAARSTGDFTLVGCTVGPGFDFADFQLLRDRPDDAHTLRLKYPRLAQFI